MEWVSGQRLLELLWPLNDMFRARESEIRAQPYDEAFAAEADDAIRAYAAAPDSGAWSAISVGAWRVLLERHTQLAALATLNEMQGQPVTVQPVGLAEQDQRIGLMLSLLLRMTLPLPPGEPRFPGRPQRSPAARGH